MKTWEPREFPSRFVRNCESHTLPDMSTKILRVLEHPADLIALNLEAKKWFSRIDKDGGGSLSAHEVREEFQRLGIDQFLVDRP